MSGAAEGRAGEKSATGATQRFLERPLGRFPSFSFLSLIATLIFSLSLNLGFHRPCVRS